MSAFIVDSDHIDLMVSAALDLPGVYTLRWQFPDDPTITREMNEGLSGWVGSMLLAENARSVNHRYSEDELEPVYEFSRVPRSQYDAVTVLKAVSCYEYQSCEHEGWQGSDAQRFCDALRHAAIAKLPGYSDAPWEWSRERVSA